MVRATRFTELTGGRVPVQQAPSRRFGTKGGDALGKWLRRGMNQNAFVIVLMGE
jgi:hypothetical protein